MTSNYHGPSPSSPARPVRLRVLCLHDAGGNAKELQAELRALGRRLLEAHGIDLVYANAPLLAATADASGDPLKDPFCAEPRRVWWHHGRNSDNDEEDNEQGPSSLTRERSEHNSSVLVGSAENDDGNKNNKHDNEFDQDDDEIPEPASQGQQQFVGLDASLLLLREVWTSAPHWGLLGVGQGAAVASLLSLLPTTCPPPQCLVLCRTSHTLIQDEERLSHVPCLHLVGAALAARVPNDASDILIAQFGGQVVARKADTDASSSRSFSKSDLNAIGRFLVSRQRALWTNVAAPSRDSVAPDSIDEKGRGREIVALQAVLHAADLEASEYVAREVAANPPKSLMAIILPRHVGGWHGGRRRQPGEQGGGAPCPEEFLLNRDKRTAATDGGSRHHPRASNQPTDSQGGSATASIDDEKDSR
jgi:hypothetical protein